MDNIVEFSKKHINTIYIVCAVIVILIITCLYFKHDNRDIVNITTPPESNYQEAHTDENQGSSLTKLIVFYAPWCGHCKRLMNGAESIWEKLKLKNSNNKNITFDQVNCDERPDFATKFQIKEFPTILKLKNDTIEKFVGDRDLETLDHFTNN